MQEGSTSHKDLMFDRDLAYACTFGRVHQVRITLGNSGIVCVCDIILGLIMYACTFDGVLQVIRVFAVCVRHISSLN